MATVPIIERENDSREIVLNGNVVEWKVPTGAALFIDLTEVVAIGEYTTDSGPFADDWFLVFVFRNGIWKEISVYADGFQELVAMLSLRFAVDFSKNYLTNVTVWKSFVRYPANIEGKELFVFKVPDGYQPSATILQSIKMALGLGIYGKAWDIKLTLEVKAVVGLATK